MIQGFHAFDHPVRIDSFQPHGTCGFAERLWRSFTRKRASGM